MSAGAGIYLVVDAAFSLLSAKFERDAILARVKEREAQGATPEQIVADLRTMRDEAIAKAQDTINRA
jgi:hypothetical protein